MLVSCCMNKNWSMYDVLPVEEVWTKREEEHCFTYGCSPVMSPQTIAQVPLADKRPRIRSALDVCKCSVRLISKYLSPILTVPELLEYWYLDARYHCLLQVDRCHWGRPVPVISCQYAVTHQRTANHVEPQGMRANQRTAGSPCPQCLFGIGMCCD